MKAMSSERLLIEEEPVPERPERVEEAKEMTFEAISEGVRIEGLYFHKQEHDAEGKDPKVFHTSEHPRTMERRGEKMADIFHLSPEERGIMDSAIAWHDTVIEYDPADPGNLLAMVKRHRGAREGDKPSGTLGNEGTSARLLEGEMLKANEKAGKELFTEEQIRTAVWAVEATYPDVNLGPDFKGAPFEEYPYYATALEQNPDLKELFDELKEQGIVKGPLFFQPHLEKALEKGESVPREVLITALADLGAAGLAGDKEFFNEGDSEARELYANLRRSDVMRRLSEGGEEADKADREKVTVVLTGWLDSQPGFAVWQALRFEKIVHLLKKQNALSQEEEAGLRGQFSRYPENVRAARDRAKEARETIEKLKSTAGEKEAFLYLTRTLGFRERFAEKELVPEKEHAPEGTLEEARGSYIDAYRKWAREPKHHRVSREVFQGQAELLQRGYERVLESQAKEYFSRRRGGLELEEGIGASEIEELEKRFRAEMFREFVVKEQDALNRAKAESRPPKDQNIFKKFMGRWSRIPRPARWAISAAIATGAAMTFGGLAAGGAAGVALYAGARLGRAALSGLVTLGTERLTALGLKGWDKFIGKKKTREYRVGELEEEGTVGIESNLKEVEGRYRAILEETARRERRRNLAKFVAAAAAGGAAGVFGGGLVDKLLGATPPTEIPEAVPETETSPAPEAFEVPETPEAPEVPGLPEVPELPETPPLSVLEHLEYRGGPHVWGEIERQIGERPSFKGIFGGMAGDELEAHRTHFIDYFKDKVYEHPEAYGLPENVGIDALSETQLRDADWDRLFNEVAGSSEEMRRALPKLTPDEVKGIIESNERMRELFAARSTFPADVPASPVEPISPFVETEAPEAPTVDAELIKPDVPETGTVKPSRVEVPVTVEVESEPIESAVPETVTDAPAQTPGEAYYARMQEDGGTLLKRITPEAAPEAVSHAAVERALHTDALVHEVAVKLVPSHDTSFLHLASLAHEEGLTNDEANRFVEYLMQRRGNRRMRRGLLAFFMDKEPSPNSIFKRWVWNDDKFKVTVRGWLEQEKFREAGLLRPEGSP